MPLDPMVPTLTHPEQAPVCRRCNDTRWAYDPDGNAIGCWEPVHHNGHVASVDDEPAEAAEPAESPRLLSLRWVPDALAEPPEEKPVLVEGLLRAGELCVIAAPRAIGKSWFAMNLAVLLANGDGWLAGTLPLRRSARVLYCQGEIDEWESCRRWAMLTGDESPPESVAETFDRWRLRTVRRRSQSSGGDQGARFTDSEEWVDAQLDGRLEATVAEHGIDVVVIDPWAVYFAGSENSNDETEAALDKLRDLSLRHGTAIVILHHVSKTIDVREPEDAWRGASRLADWASTRVTIRPHWTEQQATAQNMTRRQARRYVDVSFLRRSTPTDDFSMRLDEHSGWWERWTPGGAPDGARTHLEVPDVVAACEAAGGSWPSTRQAAQDLGLGSSHTAGRLLKSCLTHGALERFEGANGGHGWRLPGTHLEAPEDKEVTP